MLLLGVIHSLRSSEAISYYNNNFDHLVLITVKPRWGVLEAMNAEWNYPRYRHAAAKISLQWRHNGRDSVSNHQPHKCLLNCLFRRRSKKTSKLCVTGLCAGNSPGTGEFPAQMASYAENVSLWWRHHVEPGSWAPFQYKDHLSRFVEFHYKDKLVVRPSYLFTGKSTSLYWGSPRGIHLNIRIIFASVPIPILKMRQLWRNVFNFIMRIPSHYLRQCWPRYMLPYDITRPQCVKGNGLVPMA